MGFTCQHYRVTRHKSNTPGELAQFRTCVSPSHSVAYSRRDAQAQLKVTSLKTSIKHKYCRDAAVFVLYRQERFEGLLAISSAGACGPVRRRVEDVLLRLRVQV